MLVSGNQRGADREVRSRSVHLSQQQARHEATISRERWTRTGEARSVLGLRRTPSPLSADRRRRRLCCCSYVRQALSRHRRHVLVLRTYAPARSLDPV